MSYIVQDGQRYLLGVYRGIVVDNEDPSKIGRIQIKVPSIWGDTGVHPQWAEPSLPSNELFVIPTVGSQVWIVFEEGDPNSPIYMGSFLTAVEPHSEAKTLAPKARSIKTEESLRITLDDNTKEIQIDTGGGQTITLKKTENKIVMESNQVIEITGNTEVNVTGNSKVTIDGGTVEVNGNSELVVTTGSYDPFTMVPHPDGFTTFKAGG